MHTYTRSFLFILLAGIHTCSWTADYQEPTRAHTAHTRGRKKSNDEEGGDDRLKKIALPLGITAGALIIAGLYANSQGCFTQPAPQPSVDPTKRTAHTDSLSPRDSTRAPFAPPVPGLGDSPAEPGSASSAHSSIGDPIDKPTEEKSDENKRLEEKFKSLPRFYHGKHFRVTPNTSLYARDNVNVVAKKTLPSRYTVIGHNEILDTDDQTKEFIFWKSLNKVWYCAMTSDEYIQYCSNNANSTGEFKLYHLELTDFKEKKLDISNDIFLYEINEWQTTLRTMLTEKNNTFDESKFSESAQACTDMLSTHDFSIWPNHPNLSTFVESVKSYVHACKGKAKDAHNLHKSDPIPVMHAIVTRMQERNTTEDEGTFVQHLAAPLPPLRLDF